MSTNISKKKREDLLAKIQEIRTYIATADQDENTAKLLAYLSDLAKDVNSKKYGLVFEEHREEIDEVLDTCTPVLTEEVDLFINNGGEMNFLIEGDNLASLKLLEKTHKGKIDLIYIDPPYNTGSKNFIYDDSYVDKTDAFLHSKWLSFMKPRLKLAKSLLSPNGVIFISIDDREGAPLIVLCDEIFGQECFVSNISWQRTYSTRNDSKGIVNEVEHILVYSKQAGWQPNKLPRTAEMNGKYKNPDNDFAPWRSDNAYAPGAATHQGMVYAIQHPFTGELLYPAMSSCWRYQQDIMLEIMSGWCPYELKDLDDAEKRSKICGVSADEVRQGVKAIVLSLPAEESKKIAQSVYDKGPWPRFFFSKGGMGGIARKTYLDNVGGKLPTNYWPFSEAGHTDEAKKELKAIFDGDVPFDTPKPVRLLERILQIASSDKSTVLDFFAGSATTGHAVMKYNAEHDHSHRQFILCTVNENNICRGVAYERIKRVIDKERYGESLKYYKVDYIPISDRMYYEYADELLLHIRELVELENGISFTGNAEIAIVLTDEELDDFISGLNSTTNCESLYLGHDVLMDAAQAQVIKDHKITVHIIPDYYYKELEG